MSKSKSKNVDDVKMEFYESSLLNPLTSLVPSRKTLNEEYEELRDEIAYYQYKISRADKKDKKRRKKKEKKNMPCFLSSSKPMKARKKVLKKIKRGGLFERFLTFLQTNSKTIRKIGRMVAKLICMILNVEGIKRTISQSWLNKLDFVYQIAVNL